MAFLVDTSILVRLANSTDAQHPAAARVVVELHRRNEVLHLTPQPMPYSYRVDELSRGRLVKDLVEVANGTINLGDVGELLVELCQKRSGRLASCTALAGDRDTKPAN